MRSGSISRWGATTGLARGRWSRLLALALLAAAWPACARQSSGVRGPPAPVAMDADRALGMWQAGQGPLRIVRLEGGDGALVRGAWRFQQGGEDIFALFCGRQHGNVLELLWREPDRPRALEGRGFLVFAPDGARFNGKWWATSGDLAGDWYGRRADADRPVLRPSPRPVGTCGFDGGLCEAYVLLGELDRAITACERMATDPERVDALGSAWLNLSRALLARKQPRPARSAAQEYVSAHEDEPQGYIVGGDAYLQEQDWENALRWYLEAREHVEEDDPVMAELGIKLGIAYRRLNRPGDAIHMLEAGLAADPSNLQAILELGGAYLADKQDGKAMRLVADVVAVGAADGAPWFAGLSKPDRAALYIVAGRAAYNLAAVRPLVGTGGGEDQKAAEALAYARMCFEAARELRPEESKARDALVHAINFQAYRAYKFGNANATRAEALLRQAHAVEPGATLTNHNLAVLALARGQCEVAREHLEAIEDAPDKSRIVYHRLLARAYLCLEQPDTAKATWHYARAEERARSRKEKDNLALAEVYTEWAPLLVTDLDDAVDKLEIAAQLAFDVTGLGGAAKRNLALVLYRRGWQRLGAGNAAGAVEDFSRAAQDPSLLRGTELALLALSEAVARLRKGERRAATRILQRLTREGGQAKYLEPPYQSLRIESLRGNVSREEIFIEPKSLSQPAMPEVGRHFWVPPRGMR